MGEDGGGARIRTGESGFCRPLPCLLATPPGLLERETGLEPATFSLARRRSTSELLPLAVPHYTEGPDEKKARGIPEATRNLRATGAGTSGLRTLGGAPGASVDTLKNLPCDMGDLLKKKAPGIPGLRRSHASD